MKKTLLVLLIVCFGIFSLNAQVRQLSGTVRSSEDNSTLPGVSVQIKGTTIGTTTDIDGRFTLKATNDAKVLVFSFVGFNNQEVQIGDKTVFNVVLQSSVIGINEVVVTGVGAATDKRKGAISVESVNEKSLTRTPSLSIDNALMGKIAGAQIQSTSGQPGQQANIILRGINTLTSTQPMILIDGVQVNATNLDPDNSGNNSSRLSDLDLSNVERVEVVQGAAAATIYGAQGANGVIQIFTKKGKKGQKVDVRLNSSCSVDNVLRGKLEFAKNHYFATDAQGYIIGADGKRTAFDPETGFYNLPNQGYDATTLNNKPFVNPTYNHMDQYFVKNAVTLNNSLNVVGATDKIDYAFGLSSLNQESVVHGDLTKYNLTANTGVELFKGFTLRSNTQLVSSNNTTGGINNRNSIYSGMSNALMVPQYVDLTLIDAKGNPPVIHNVDENSINPFYTYKFHTTEMNIKRVIQGINANYKLNKFVEFDYKYGIDYYQYYSEDFIKNQTQTANPNKGINPKSGQMTRYNTTETQQNSIISAFARVDFQKDLGLKIPLSSTTQVAYDWRKNDYHNIRSRGTDLNTYPPFTFDNAGATSASEEITEFITFGYLVNQKFDYGTLFGVSAGFRSDWSSEFGEASKPFTFPRADAYFRVSELLKLDYVPELKLRAAYGEAGIQPSAYYRQITLGTNGLGTGNYFYPEYVSRNPALDVEVSKELEVGLDYIFSLNQGLWLNKLSGSVVYWNRKSVGTIYSVDVAPSTGAAGLLTNAIDLKGDGIQFSLDVDVVSSKTFEWKFGARFSKGSTLVDKISNGKPIVIGQSGSGMTSIVEGKPVGALFGFQPLSSLDQTTSKGVRYIAQDQVANYELVNGMVVKKDSKQVQFTTEQTDIGDNTPDFSMSFFNDFTLFKNLSVSLQIDWVKGPDVYNQTRQWLYRDRIHEDFDKEVTINGQTGAFVNYYASLYNTNKPNSYFVENGSFIRLRNVSVSYDFGKLINSPWIKGLVLSVSGRNLLTITDYTGMDPEANGTNVNDPLSRGTDLWAFPNMRSYSVSLNLNF